MLSKSCKMTRPELLRSLPEIEHPITVRLKFVKKGKLQYISHLDLQRTFNRIIVRSGLPVWYTKGFNPHVKLVFSTPLSVGTQSVCEFLDIKVDRDIPCEDIKNMLNAEMTDEMYITEAYLPSSKFSDIAFCEYDYEISSVKASEELADKINKLFSSSPLMLTKRTKSGEREVDITKMMRSLSAVYNKDSATVRMNAILNADVEGFLNPEMIVTAIKVNFGILQGDDISEWYSIMRKKCFTSDMTEFH